MAHNKKTLYVGGLPDDVDIKLLKSMFSAFGDVVDINLPMDYTTNKHKGYAFVEYQWPEDAADAIDNMDNSEILGKTIRANIAKPTKFKDNTSRAIWDHDEYLRKLEAGLNPIEDDNKEDDDDDDNSVANPDNVDQIQ